MGFAENIKKLRFDHAITQQDLAKIAGVTDKAVSKWELGQAKPRMGTAQRIAKHFNIPVTRLTDEYDISKVRDDFMVLASLWTTLNEDGRKALNEYASFLASKEEYREVH